MKGVSGKPSSCTRGAQAEGKHLRRLLLALQPGQVGFPQSRAGITSGSSPASLLALSPQLTPRVLDTQASPEP